MGDPIPPNDGSISTGGAIDGDRRPTRTRVTEFILATSPLDKIRAILKHYPEMTALTGRTNPTPEEFPQTEAGKTIGEMLFPDIPKDDLIEFNKTAVGILALDWIRNGDYESFTACQTPKTKLSREKFQQLRDYARIILPDDEALDAMIVYVVINDLGKIASVIEDITRRAEIEEIDHDKILSIALERYPDISSSFQSLSPRYQEMIIKGLGAKFNLPQFVRGENVPASLEGLPGIDQDSLDFYLLHSIADVAGAAGQSIQNGSAVMTKPTYSNFEFAISSIERLKQGRSITEVYNDYLEKRATPLGFDISDPTQKALTRVACMFGFSEEQQAVELIDVMENLSTDVRSNLEQELNRNGIDDGYAILLYYSPALLSNLRIAYETTRAPNGFRRCLEVGLITLARLFQEARNIVVERDGDGVYTVNIENIARQGINNPEMLLTQQIQLTPVGNDAVASLS